MIPCLLAANGNAAALLSRLHHASSACSLTSHHTCDTTLRHDNQARLTYWERLAQRPGQPHVQGPPLQSEQEPCAQARLLGRLCVCTPFISTSPQRNTPAWLANAWLATMQAWLAANSHQSLEAHACLHAPPSPALTTQQLVSTAQCGLIGSKTARQRLPFTH